MNTQFILSFVMLFGSTIALICAVYVLLIHKRNLKRKIAELEANKEETQLEQ